MAATLWQEEDQDFDPFEDLDGVWAAQEEEEYLTSLLEPPPEPTNSASAVLLPVDAVASQQVLHR